ncbi:MULTISPECIES: DUF4376 domain-containing protein [Halomonas]|uniref:DUF4376 domain-containing protein n=1 Tax=Halomonas TaxID=2745 RepID=UPI001C98B02F|nr:MULTISPECIES: DUF4376 domain-containing protein [Halomonas]MBY6206892.1 DUF4376 domain-containing protein [Halomonas sp. DP3Y7-2]MBY6230366.1 DUF4376 domain-containing protein [Halomonas sp. DP3Y7-1]MCA0918527.1 DUF4376 domain-containing protein [Halomonas denitrificans]
MMAYSYHPTTGEYVGHQMADPDPMQPGNWLFPAYSTDIEPPTIGKNQTAVHDDEAWSLVPDWRGYQYWLADGTDHEITELGIEPPDDALSEAPPEPAEHLAARKRAAIAAALAAELAAGMPYTLPDGTADVVQMQAEDRQNLMGLAIEARDLVAAGETGAVQEFRAQSNTRYPMTPDEVIAMTDQAMAHYKQLLEHSWDRKDTIAAALADETLTDDEKRAAIEAVTW